MYLGIGKLAVVIRVKPENPVKTHDETTRPRKTQLHDHVSCIVP